MGQHQRNEGIFTKFCFSFWKSVKDLKCKGGLGIILNYKRIRSHDHSRPGVGGLIVVGGGGGAVLNWLLEKKKDIRGEKRRNFNKTYILVNRVMPVLMSWLS